MYIRFSVTSFSDPYTRLGVIGSIEELGAWDITKCIPLHPYNDSGDELDPSMWSKSIFIDGSKYSSTTEPIDYKFIAWKVDTQLPIIRKSAFPLENEIAIPQPVLATKDLSLLLPPTKKDKIMWEGFTNQDNRQIIFSDTPNELMSSSKLVHYISPCHLQEEYILPVPIFRDDGMTSMTELSYTTRSYLHHKAQEDINYHRILNRVLVGSSPRKLQHILHLRDKENVTDIMNFQTTDDIFGTFISEDPDVPTNPQNLAELYKNHNLNYVWAPMEDMCTVSRSLQTSQNIAILMLLLERSDCTGIYIHCNAGIGRSICCVAGYMSLILNAPLYLTQLLIKIRRPVAHFDEYALNYVAEDFNQKFSALYMRCRSHDSKSIEANEVDTDNTTTTQESITGQKIKPTPYNIRFAAVN